MNNINFEIISKLRHNVCVRGFVDSTDIDSEDAVQFYDALNQPCWRVPANPYRETGSIEELRLHDVYEKLIYEFQTDDLFLQFIGDFADSDESTDIIDRNNYILMLER